MLQISFSSPFFPILVFLFCIFPCIHYSIPHESTIIYLPNKNITRSSFPFAISNIQKNILMYLYMPLSSPCSSTACAARSS